MPLTTDQSTILGRENSDFQIRAGVLEKYNGEPNQVAIPNNVTIIGSKAFYGCKGLSIVIIPEGVTQIDDWAFRDCINLQCISIPESVKVIGKWAFNNCVSLSVVLLPANVEIGEGAFSGCKHLETITIKTGSTVDYNAFSDSGLCSVMIEPHVSFKTTITFNDGTWGGRGIVTRNIWDYSGGVDDHYDRGCICPFFGCNNLTNIPWIGALNPKIFFGTPWYEKHRTKQAAEFRNKKVCQYCGGNFSGFFLKVCNKCGRKKDY